MPSNSPSVSTATCRVRPFSRLAASQPRGPPLSVVFTLWVSMMAAVGLGFPPGALAQHDHEVVANTLPHPLSEESAHIAVHGAPGRKGWRWWQMPPLAAAAHEIEAAVQQLSHVRSPRPPTGFGGRDERLPQAKLVVSQGLSRAKIPDQRAISRRPHGGLHAGNRLKTPPSRPDQPVKPAPSPLCKRALSTQSSV